MATIDLRQGAVGTSAAKPVLGIDTPFTMRMRIDSTDLSKYTSSVAAGVHLVSGNSYYLLAIPPYSILVQTVIQIITPETLAGTVALYDGAITPRAATVVSGAADTLLSGTTSLPKYYGASGGYLQAVIAVADITVGVFDVWLVLIDALYNISAGSTGTGQ